MNPNKKKNEKASNSKKQIKGRSFRTMEEYEFFFQECRRESVSKLRNQRYYGPECDKKTCIGPRGNPVSWKEKSCGVSWIGVTGTDTTCVITMKNQDELRRGLYGKRQLQIKDVLATAIVDMSDQTGSYFSIRQRFPSKAVVPFAAVSVAPDVVVKDHLEISHELQEQASHAINFLEAKLKNWSRLSSKETTKIAVCALKCLLGPKFKSNEIELRGTKPIEGLESASDVDGYLAVMDSTPFTSCKLPSPQACFEEDA